ncbi:hypothetical protein HPB47_025669 [Ixodes persulcatus]|uniref:Uncharacterized protein n=1 Tax=Ixodes persulcatus TaxID=34615 RepID=A0AC60Q2N2_IXOPE|nr:hypothetical protein HPB47_025669 [Ixodes persulcatus]
MDLNRDRAGLDVGSQTIGALYFADDLILTPSSFEGLRSLLATTESYLAEVGLSLNPAKTVLFGWKATADRLHYNLPPIIVAGIPVPSTPINTPIRYLGIDFFINKRPVVHSHHAEDDLTIIEAASLKPFQKLRCINTLITPKYLYAASSILGSAGESAGIDKKLRRVSTEVQLKALTRLIRLGNAAVDSLFNTTIGTFHCRLASQLHVPPDLTEAEELTTALRQSRTSWWNEHRAQYANNDLFARHGQALGNTWLQPDSHHLKDGDRIKALRVRTNTYPTNAMLHHNNEAARLCRRCHQSLETPFHILQECSFIKLPRMERHNFICKQVCRLVAKYRPAATIQTEHVYQSPTGDRLKPDIIVLEGNTMTIADVAVSWDDRPASLTRMCNFKSAKYDCQRPMFPDKVVTAVGLAFGARSMLCNETVRGGGLLGLPRPPETNAFDPQYLVLNNCGLMCGGSYESIHDELGKYGDVEDIVLIPGQQFAFVAFRDVAHCVSSATLLSTRPSRLVADGSVHPAFVGKVVTLVVPERNSCGAPVSERPLGLRLVREAVDEAEEALLWRLVSWDQDCCSECQDRTWQLSRETFVLATV